MEIEIYWHKPYELVDGSDNGLTYECNRIGDIPEAAGVYVFARRFGKKVIPLYVGKSENLRTRIQQQLTGNVKLMNKVWAEPRGKRELLVGELCLKPKQNASDVIKIVEKAFIEHALNNNPLLLNEKGTKIPSHRVVSSGNREISNLFGKTLRVKR